MKRGIILLAIGVIGIGIWLLFMFALVESGQEIRSEYFLGFLIPLTFAVAGLCYDIYAVHLMFKVRGNRISVQN